MMYLITYKFLLILLPSTSNRSFSILSLSFRDLRASIVLF
jgi:hypothetical protein